MRQKKITEALPGLGHNSGAMSPLEQSADRIQTLLETHRKTGAASLCANIEIGVELEKAQAHFVKKEDFILWAAEQAGVKRRQAYNLLALAKHREALMAALDWVKRPGIKPLARWFYIDGAKDLIAAHEVAMGKRSATPKEGERPGRKAEAPTVRLRRVAVTLHQRNAVLTAALEEAGVAVPPPTLEEAAAAAEAAREVDAAALDVAKAEHEDKADPPSPKPRRRATCLPPVNGRDLEQGKAVRRTAKAPKAPVVNKEASKVSGKQKAAARRLETIASLHAEVSRAG